LRGTGGKAFVFRVRLSAPSEQLVSVQFATADGTATAADGDYQAVSGQLTFFPGQTSRTIAVWVYGDRVKEANETFALNLTGVSSATLLNGTGLGTILNDDRR
jgi:hypothetical protein